MCVERAARQADIGGAVLAIPHHPFMAAAQHTYREASTKRFSVSDKVSPNAEILLCAAQRQSEAHEDLIEDQGDSTLGADCPQLSQPMRIGLTIELSGSSAVNERRIGRRSRVRMQSLVRIDEDARDVTARAKHVKRVFGHLCQSVGFA